jgi:phosphoglycolate phosphatase-like HAD superfamily hydrolase
MTRPTVLLFDIDGTLLSSSGAGRRAMERSFELVTGHREALTFPLDGMTDRAIVRRGLAEVGADTSDATVDRIIDGYIACLPEALRAPGDYHVYPGVHAVLEACAGVDGVALGLGTGNIRRGATLKLGRVGLDSYFAFGGFGCDHEERPRIIGTGAERGAAQLGLTPGECRVVVIGDTPKDVAAAQAVGAECVGVATGRFSTAELLAAGATVAFGTLADEGVHAAILVGAGS